MSALYLRGDFPELVDATAHALGIREPAIVEKDYYVTEALRRMAAAHGSALLFKGGTSLSKGWGLIQRFSEDLDLYVETGDRGEKARESLLKSVINAANGPAFVAAPERTEGVKGMARSARLAYPSPRTSTLHPSVLIEVGIQSGTFPVEERAITSMLAAHLVREGVATAQDDCLPFTMRLLHYRRTLVEKMFALHDKVVRGLLHDGKAIGSYARHYYDVGRLLPREEVKAMLASTEYVEIVKDYRRLTVKHFPHQAFPSRLELAQSPALFPSDALASSLSKDYAEQCRTLCYGDYPTFRQVLDLLEEARPFLVPAE